MTIVREAPDFRALPAATAALFAASGEDSFFAQAAWYDLMSRHVRDPGDAVRLYLDTEDPQAALVCRVPPGPEARELHSFANFYSLEHGPLVRDGDAAGVSRVVRLMAEIAGERPAWQTIGMTALDPAAPSFAAIIDGLKAARLLVQPYFHSGTWFEDTRGLDFGRYLDTRPATLRNTYRRKAKAAQSLRVEYAFSEPGCDFERLVADYDTVYRNSWKEGEAYPTFIPALMRMAFDSTRCVWASFASMMFRRRRSSGSCGAAARSSTSSRMTAASTLCP